MDGAPIENTGQMGTVERYNDPLRTSYERIRSDICKNTSDQECLKVAVFEVNATVGPEGLCPIIIVFWAITRPARTFKSLSQVDREWTIGMEISEVQK